MCVPYANTFSTCVGTRFGLRAKSDIDKRAREHGVEGEIATRVGGEGLEYFTFRSILETAIYCAKHTYNTLELPLTTSCLGLALMAPYSELAFYQSWLAVIQATGFS